VFNSLTLRGKFLIAPFIGITISIILILSNYTIINTQKDVLAVLKQTNLTQMSKISQFSTLLVKNHTNFTLLLYNHAGNIDEEQIYVSGRVILDNIHDYEQILLNNLTTNTSLNSKDLINQLKASFSQYKASVISAIEMSTVDITLSQQSLAEANTTLDQLSSLLISLSNLQIMELKKAADLVNDTLSKKDVSTSVSVLFLLLMIISALYFSHNLSSGLDRIIQSLIALAKGKTDIKLELSSDNYLLGLTDAVLKFKNIHIQLEEQKFALDQHAIVAITDTTGTITYANKKFSQISGFAIEELVGQNHRMINSGYHPREFWMNLFTTISQGSVWHGEICNKTKSGELYWVDTTIVPFTGSSTKPISYIALRTDITNKKQAEAELIKSKNMAEAANHAKSEFLSSMSHEFRTPLNAIIGFSQLMKTSYPANSEQSENLEYILSGGRHLLNLVDQILDLASIEDGRTSIVCEEVNVKSVIKDAVHFSNILAESANVEIRLLSDLDLVITVDVTKLKQILLNLIGNAIKYNKDNGLVSIEWTLIDHERLKISISDTGLGISEADQKHVFSEFNRFGHEQSTISGTGIGLAVTKKLVELMGGEIGFESTKDVGSTFWVILPTANEPEQPESSH